jgi:hypothetical protein
VPWSPAPSPAATPDDLDAILDDEVMEMMDSLWGGGGSSDDETEATPTPTSTATATPELLLEAEEEAETPTPTASPTATPTADAEEDDDTEADTDDEAGADTAEAATEATASPEATAEASATEYRNGFYVATGGYRSPAGSEIIEVELALEDDTITNVNIIPQARHNTSLRHQQLFADGIGLQVIGTKLDEVEEFASVNGSSLTPGGFDRALVKIREEAAR